MVIARQIAEALEDAHAQGVIHRDLKPANIKITPEGKVKLLDFGLAKAMDPGADSAPHELTQSPTIMSDATQQGVILGTAAYMSPEQARGKPADHRTDIWAFGCVIYEMLTASACYAGETVTDILTVTPPASVSSLSNPLLSPDARWLAYSTNDGVLIHDLERDETLTIPALREAATLVCFSPDSEWIGFQSGGKLQKVRVTGGVPVDLVDLSGHPGTTWGSRGTIVYSPTWTSPLFEIREDGGELRQATTLDREQGETGHWSPLFLPDGRHVLFTAFTTRGSLKHAQMFLLDLDTGERVALGVGAYPVYLNNGHIVYHRSGLYEAAPFDLAQKEFTGPPRIVMEDVPYVSPSGNGVRYFSMSDNGVFARIDVDDHPDTGPSSFYWLDRNGALARIPISPAKYSSFSVSRDGKRLVSAVYEAGEFDLWVYDLDRGTGRRLTRESNNFDPVWHPDGLRIAFNSTRLGTFDAFTMVVDSSDLPSSVLADERDDWPYGWTPDGAMLLGITTDDQSDNIVIVAAGAATDLIATDASESTASISPDGRWLAYLSDRSGRSEVYVQALDGAGNAIQVSTAGGGDPQWFPGRNELVFGQGITIGDAMLVSYEVRDGRFVPGRPVPFLREGGAGSDGTRRITATTMVNNVAVAPGGRLIVSLYETNPAPRIHISLDGFGDLQRQAAAER